MLSERKDVELHHSPDTCSVSVTSVHKSTLLCKTQIHIIVQFILGQLPSPQDKRALDQNSVALSPST